MRLYSDKTIILMGDRLMARPHRYASKLACEALRAGRTTDSMYYTYVLKSLRDKDLYVGQTDDLKNRLFRHNKGLVRATKHRRPLELVYYEACKFKQDAVNREKSLKTGFGRAYLKRRLSEK